MRNNLLQRGVVTLPPAGTEVPCLFPTTSRSTGTVPRSLRSPFITQLNCKKQKVCVPHREPKNLATQRVICRDYRPISSCCTIFCLFLLLPSYALHSP